MSIENINWKEKFHEARQMYEQQQHAKPAAFILNPSVAALAAMEAAYDLAVKFPAGTEPEAIADKILGEMENGTFMIFGIPVFMGQESMTCLITAVGMKEGH